jgi:hypothetical protein
MLSAIMASIVVTKNGRKCGCCNAAKATFDGGAAGEEVNLLSWGEFKVGLKSQWAEPQNNG